jgi:hypothetical protein
MSIDKKLADARPRRLDPTHRPDPAAIMARPRPTETVRRPARRRLVLAGLVPAVAVVAAGAVVLANQTAPDHPPTTAHSTKAEAPRKMPTSAHELFLVAAARSESDTATGGRYWVQPTEFGSTVEVGPPGRRYHIMLRHSMEFWFATRPGDRTLGVDQYLGAEPASPEDAAAWRADGSPTRWPVPGPDGTPSDKFYEAAPGPQGIRYVEGATAANNFLLGGNPVSLSELAALPTDPAALKTWLLNRLHQLGNQEPDDYSLFWNGKSLVMDLPVTPAVRAAAYRMMADLTGVTLLGEVTDQRGRSGMAVAYTHDGDGGPVEFRLIIDPDTGQALAEENRNTAGELSRYTLVDGMGFRDEEAPAK